MVLLRPELYLTCDKTTFICTSALSCDNLGLNDDNVIRLSLDDGKKLYDIKLSDLFISSNGIGLEGNQCILGVFQSSQVRGDTYYVGAIGFNDWYFVFDMTQYD